MNKNKQLAAEAWLQLEKCNTPQEEQDVIQTAIEKAYNTGLAQGYEKRAADEAKSRAAHASEHPFKMHWASNNICQECGRPREAHASEQGAVERLAAALKQAAEYLRQKGMSGYATACDQEADEALSQRSPAKASEQGADRLALERAFREGYKEGYSNGSNDCASYERGGGNRTDVALAKEQDEAWLQSDAATSQRTTTKK